MVREKPSLFDMMTPTFKNVTWQPSCFQNEVKITLRQAFLAIYNVYACANLIKIAAISPGVLKTNIGKKSVKNSPNTYPDRH